MTPGLDPTAHPWMRAPHVRAAMNALEAARPGASRFVGGCVRNALLGAPVEDVDIATQLKPDDVIAALGQSGVKAVPTGVEHGTVTAVKDGQAVEITTLRRDVSTDGRRAVVAFTQDWAEDSARRDFRINALYADITGAVHDPQGGLADIAERRFIFIGDADQRIQEDYLRILRFFRFFAWYGAGRPDREGMLACVRNKDGLSRLSAERIWKELKKLLAAPDPGAALRWMTTTNMLETVSGMSHGVDTAARLPALERDQGWAIDPMLRFLAIAPPNEDRARAIAARLKLSKAERRRLIDWARLAQGKARGEGLIEPDSMDARLYRDGVQPHADRLRR